MREAPDDGGDRTNDASGEASGAAVVVDSVNNRIEARWAADRPGSGISVDFSGIAFPSGLTAVRGMPLVRACGAAEARAGARLVDATAGLGYDAFLLAAAGFRVTCVERSPLVARLLADGLRRLAEEPAPLGEVAARMALLVGDARQLFGTPALPDAEVCYLDPMYPPKKRASALPPKEMQIVRALVGADLDAGELFGVALRHSRRVVVKRPLHAEPLGRPESTVSGKLARFDRYRG